MYDHLEIEIHKWDEYYNDESSKSKRNRKLTTLD